MPNQPDADGSRLLTSDEVGELLASVVANAGGTLRQWALDHVDVHPGNSTTATFTATVEWSWGVAPELLGVSVRADGPDETDEKAGIFRKRGRFVAAWVHPFDPDLPGLPRVTLPDQAAALLNESGALAFPVTPDRLSLTLLTYRPRRRAVVRLEARPPHGGAPIRLYAKTLRAGADGAIAQRLTMLRQAGLPAAPIAAHLPQHAVVLLAELPGRSLAQAMFEEPLPCGGEQVVALLDALPLDVARLPRRRPWSDSIAHYADVVAGSMPGERERLAWMVRVLESELAAVPDGHEPTHGDFHEGQVHVAGGRIVGVLDADTLGPGRRVDDLACLVAHLSTVQRMSPEQQRLRDGLVRAWVPVFDQRVDPVQLRLRAASVVVSLATGPFRSQEPDWQRSTAQILDAAEALVRQVR